MSASELLIHCHPNGCDHWSGRLPEPTGPDGPLKSPARALQLVRLAKRAGRGQHGARIVLANGRYPLDRPLEIGPSEAGGLVIEAAEGETPILDGSREITGWHIREDNQGPLWEADVQDLLTATGGWRDVLVNGTIVPPARLPLEGSWPLNGDSVSAMVHRSRITLPPDAVAAVEDSPDAEMVIRGLFTASRARVTGPSENSLRLEQPIAIFGGDDRWTNQVHLEQVRGGLATPGTWFLDRNLCRLFYRPLPGQTPESTRIAAAPLENLLILAGDPDHAILGSVHLRGITFTGCGHATPPRSRQSEPDLSAAVRIRAAGHGLIEQCTFRDNGASGLDLGEACWGWAVLGCEFTSLGGCGIVARGPRLRAPHFDAHHRPPVHLPHDPARMESGGHHIHDNHVHHIGLRFHAASGIVITDAVECRISHNEISHCFYTGLSLGWTWGYWPQNSGGHRVEFNHIHHLGMRMLSDMAGIYLLGTQYGTVVRGNHIHDVDSDLYGGFGINLDEGTSHALIEQNLIRRVSSQCLHLHFGSGNILRDNILADGDEGILAISRGNHMVWPEKGASGLEPPGTGMLLLHNLLVSDGQALVVGALGDATGSAWADGVDAQANAWADRKGPATFGDGIHGTGGPESLTRSGSFPDWQALGHDAFGAEVPAPDLDTFPIPARPGAGPRVALDPRKAGIRPLHERTMEPFNAKPPTAHWP